MIFDGTIAVIGLNGSFLLPTTYLSVGPAGKWGIHKIVFMKLGCSRNNSSTPWCFTLPNTFKWVHYAMTYCLGFCDLVFLSVNITKMICIINICYYIDCSIVGGIRLVHG